MDRIVGIDLGTTNSLVATVDSGIPVVIADAEGKRLTPSMVRFAAGGAPIVGWPAQRARAANPRETVYSVKRFIGRRASDIGAEEMVVTYPLSRVSRGPLEIQMQGRTYTPEHVSGEILKKLKRDAEAYFGHEIRRAVITVPAYFNDAQRSATKTAGELAGFTVERIINEPTAAALAYGLDKLKERSKIAVYDLGGGTFDLSILELHEGVFQVLATNGNTRLGGDDLDRRIVDFLLERIRHAGGPDLTEARGEETANPTALAALARVHEAAEAAKIGLSSDLETEIALPFLAGEFSFACKLTRVQLEDLTRDIVARTRQHCLRSLADARLDPKELDQVILVGGQTRMPLVRQFVRDLFTCSDFEETRGNIRLGTRYHEAAGPELNTSQNPDEAVALGAAIQAEILSGGFKNVLLLDVTPLSLGLETFGGLMNVLIPRNSTIPVKAGEMFTTAVDNQREMLIHVLQGERERAQDNWSLGIFTLNFEPAPRGVARVGVQFEIDANGILHVLARDVATGQEKVVKMSSAVDVDDAAVQRMVEESVEHAFDDLAERRWIETSFKATQIIEAARKGLGRCAEELDSDARARIEAALQEVQLLLANATADPDGTAKLQSACQALDVASRPLAEILMDRAMEDLLKKRGVIT